MVKIGTPIGAGFGEAVSALGSGQPATRGHMSRRAVFEDATTGPQRVFHGTAESGAESILSRGVRTGHRFGQSQGPGFYVTPSEQHAEQYAERASGMQAGADPAVLAVDVTPEKGISLRHDELVNIGRQFRRKHGERPGVQNKPDAFLGNVALRQKGYDYLHINAGPRKIAGDPETAAETDFGIVLNPKIVSSVERTED